MKKHIFLLLGVFSLGACASFQQQKVVWTGQNFDNYIVSYGIPSSQYTLQNGNTVFSFKKNCAQTNAQEEILITVDTENIIQQTSILASCPTPPPPPQEYYINEPIIEYHPEPAPKPKEIKQEIPAPKPQDSGIVSDPNVSRLLKEGDEILKKVNKSIEQTNITPVKNQKSSQELLKEKLQEVERKNAYKKLARKPL